jgi:hypothetical protein
MGSLVGLATLVCHFVDADGNSQEDIILLAVAVCIDEMAHEGR